MANVNYSPDRAEFGKKKIRIKNGATQNSGSSWFNSPDIMVIGARGIPGVEGGAEKNAEKVFPLLVERGYSIEVVGINRYICESTFKGVTLTGLPTTDIMKSDKVIYNFLAFFYSLIKRPKLVHLQGINGCLFLWFYKLFGLRVVLRLGSSDADFKKWSGFEQAIIRFCEYQIRFADQVIAVSENLKNYLITKKLVRHVHVIPNGIDPVEITLEAEAYWSNLGLEKGKYVLAVGRLTVDKDFETLIKAVGMLADDGVKLVIVGGPDEKAYSERLLALGNERIKFTGCIDRSLLPVLYSNCAIYAHSSRHEGLSNAVLEAISYSCPLVVSDIPANLEMPLNKLSYFPVGEAQILAQKLEEALNKPSEFVANAGNFCDWLTVAERTEEIYKNIFEKSTFHSFVGSS